LSDVADPKSYANTLTDKRYRNLAAAVNFAADGTVTTARGAQVESDELATIKLYNSRIPADATELEKTRAKTESTYYHTAISTVERVDELMADKRLVTYVLKAYGLDKESIPNNVLRQVLTSDPQDPKSVANKLNDSRYRDLAAAYNFRSDGSVARVPFQQAQTRSEAIKTADLYLYQTMESEAGNQNEGVRLALYFRRKASNIGTAFDILADKALLEVVRNALACRRPCRKWTSTHRRSCSRSAQVRRLQGPGEGREVPGEIRRPLRPGQQHLVRGDARVPSSQRRQFRGGLQRKPARELPGPPPRPRMTWSGALGRRLARNASG